MTHFTRVIKIFLYPVLYSIQEMKYNYECKKIKYVYI